MKPSGRNLSTIWDSRYGRAATIMLLGICLAGTAPAWGHAKSDAPSPGSSAGASPTPPKFNVPIPVSHDARGVKLPYYDERGRLQMYFVIAKAYRMDLKHLEMKKAYMQTYDEKETPDANVYMSDGILDLDTRIVTSDVPVIVRRSDFQIVGQKMVFNTQTRVGHMSGHVRMILYNHTAIAAPSPTISPVPAKGAIAPQPTATPK